jgi:hypothetical protein
MRKKVKFMGMSRYPNSGKAEIIKQFQGTKPSEIEQKVRAFIEDQEKESSYHPRKRNPFTFFYKIGNIELVLVFFNGWRILGRLNESGNINDITAQDEEKIKKTINGEN